MDETVYSMYRVSPSVTSVSYLAHCSLSSRLAQDRQLQAAAATPSGPGVDLFHLNPKAHGRTRMRRHTTSILRSTRRTRRPKLPCNPLALRYEIHTSPSKEPSSSNNNSSSNSSNSNSNLRSLHRRTLALQTGEMRTTRNSPSMPSTLPINSQRRVNVGLLIRVPLVSWRPSHSSRLQTLVVV